LKIHGLLDDFIVVLQQQHTKVNTEKNKQCTGEKATVENSKERNHYLESKQKTPKPKKKKKQNYNI
jgi:hypothetical protein